MVPTAQKPARPALSGRSIPELEQVITDRLQFAVKALATDQPNLAKLYMKRAIENIQELRYRLATGKAVRSVLDFIRDIFANVMEALAPAIEAMGRAFRIFSEAFQSDFALAAPQ